MKKKTVEQFIEEANRIHNHKFDYGKVVYITNKTKVKIICPIHREFEQRPWHHLSGMGCPKCTWASRVLTNDEFILRASKIHNHKYDYSKSNYDGYHEKIIIICPLHGEFKQTSSEHLSGKGCPKCWYTKTSLIQRTSLPDFIESANKTHNNFYIKGYDKVKYINSDTKVIIKCPIHGYFKQTPHNHLQGQGCPICRSSKSEKVIFGILTEREIKFTPQYRFDGCKGKRVRLPFDFYLPDYNAVIEYDGEQHFRGWKSCKESLKTIQASDSIKNAYCKANKIKIIRIRYDEDITQRVQEFLDWGNTLDFHWE